MLGGKLEIGLGLGFSGASIAQRLGDVSVTLPDLSLTDTTIDQLDRLQVATDPGDPKRQIAKIDIDLAPLLQHKFVILQGLPPFGELSFEAGPFSAQATLLSYDAEVELSLNQDVSAVPVPQVQLEFTDSAGQPVTINTIVDGQARNGVTSIAFAPGADVELIPPGAERVTVKPTLVPTFQFQNELGLDVRFGGELKALELIGSAFGINLLEIGPMISNSHSFFDLDLGSVFDTQFEIAEAPIRYEPFQIGGPLVDVVVASNGFARVMDNLVSEGFVLEVDNLGPETAKNVVVTVSLAGASNVFTFDAAGSDSRCAVSGEQIVCQVGDLVAGASTQIAIRLIPDVPSYGNRYLAINASSDGRDANSNDNSMFIEATVAKPHRFRATNGNTDQVYDGRDPGEDFRSLRWAIGAANANPGPDIIEIVNRRETREIQLNRYQNPGPLVITEAVQIIAPSGTTILSHQDQIELFYVVDTNTLRIYVPADNDQRRITARDVVDVIQSNDFGAYVNRQPIPITATIDEGEGTGELRIEENQSFSAVMRGGSPTTRASATIDLPGDDNRFTIWSELGDRYNDMTIEFVLVQPIRSRLIEFGGSGPQEYALDNIVLAGGNATSLSNSSFDGLGGAILISDPDDKLTLTHVTIRDSAAEQGGAIFADFSGGPGGNSTPQLVIQDSLIEGNSVAQRGGGIHVINGNASIQNSIIRDNNAGISGGGIALTTDSTQPALVSLIGSRLVDNDAASGGGGISAHSASETIPAGSMFENSVVARNHQPQEYQSGGITSASNRSNLIDQSSPLFDNVGDRVDRVMNVSPVHPYPGPSDISSVPRLLIPTNTPGAAVASLAVNVPHAGTTSEYSVDDPRFEVVERQLKLKSDWALESVDDRSFRVMVTATDSNGVAYSQPIMIDALPKPTTPSGFNLSPRPQGGLFIDWLPSVSGRETEYRIYQIDGETETLLATLGTHSAGYEVSGLSRLETYSFVIEASNPSGTARTAIQSITMPLPRPTVLRDAVVEAVSETIARLTWTDSEYEDGYRIVYGGNQIIVSANQTSVELPFTDNNPLQITVTPFNSTFEGLPIQLSVAPRPSLPSAPSLLNVEWVSANLVRVTWSEAADATQYIVFRTGDPGDATEVGRTGAGVTTFDVKVAGGSVRDQFLVLALNAAGSVSTIGLEGEFSDGFVIDSAVIPDAGRSLSLSELGRNRYPQLVSLDLDGRGANRLIVTLDDLKQLTESSDKLDVRAGEDDLLEFGADDWVVDDGIVENGTYYRVVRSGDAVLRLDRPDQCRNPLSHFDVNTDGATTALDALNVINSLGVYSDTSPANQRLPDLSSFDMFPGLYLDVDGNGFATPLDALIIINQIARQSPNRENESVLPQSNGSMIAGVVMDSMAGDFVEGTESNRDVGLGFTELATERARTTKLVGDSAYSIPAIDDDHRWPEQEPIDDQSSLADRDQAFRELAQLEI